MRITRLGHAAILIESDTARILVDPGGFSDSWHGLGDLNAILVTHQHRDHVDPAHLAGLMRANPEAGLRVEEEVVPVLAGEGLQPHIVRPGDTFTVGSVEVETVGGRHAVIHDRVPVVGNVGFVFHHDGKRLYHPGDSYAYPLADIDVLALPLAAPWARAATTADFLAAVRPSRAFPIHDAIVNDRGRNLYMRLAKEFGGEGVELHPIGPTDTFDI